MSQSRPGQALSLTTKAPRREGMWPILGNQIRGFSQSHVSYYAGLNFASRKLILFSIWARMISYISTNRVQALRAELFSIEQLKVHARSLAEKHELDGWSATERLLPRLAENEKVLLQAYELVSEAITENRRVSPAAEWLLDNFYLIEQQIQMARRHLPRAYSRQLPRLLHGSSAGFPRVYDLMLELIAHVDGRVDAENLTSFIVAYQTVNALKLSELWAIPIMLRLALIENLRGVAQRIAFRRQCRNQAGIWADRLVETSEKNPKQLVFVLADLARTNPQISSAFVDEFCRRLQGGNPSLNLALSWIEQRLAEEEGVTTEQLLRADSHNQSADQVTVSHSIGSLRFLGAMNWNDFVENMSAVEKILRQDPAGVCAGMHFATRDRYRHCVEDIAKAGRLNEPEVSLKAVELARSATETTDEGHRTRNVGYYLIGKGRTQLERETGSRWSFRRSALRVFDRFAHFCYLAPIALLTVLVGWLGVAHGQSLQWTGWRLGLVGVLAFLSASHLAVTIVNLLSTLLVKPRLLPRMDFSSGIPPEHRTMTVVPVLL